MINPSLLVHVGLDGWLFLTGGTNFVTTLYQRDGGHLPDRNLSRWRDAILERQKKCEKMGIAYAHLVVPEKLTIYGSKLAQPLVDVDQAPAIRLLAMFNKAAEKAGYVDLVVPMRAQHQEIDLYWRTDTHWTPQGCLLAYERLCAALGLTPNAELAGRPAKEYGKVMDLGGKLQPPIWERVREIRWLRDSTRIYENEVLRILETPEFGGAIHVGAHARFNNPKAVNDKRLLLFGDSFADAGPFMLTAALAETVSEVEFVWSANIDWGLVAARKPDFLVTQMAERYMALPPGDTFNLRRTELGQTFRAYRQRLANWYSRKFGSA